MSSATELLLSLVPGDKVTVSDPTDSYGNWKRRKDQFNLFGDMDDIRTGSILTVERVMQCGTYVRVYCTELCGYLTKTNIDMTKIQKTSREYFTSEIDQLKQKIKEYESQIQLIELRLKFMEDTQSDVFDESQFKVWSVLTIIDENPNMDRLEKTKRIATIVGN